MGALKVVLLGDSAVGKSSLLRSYTTGTFDAHLPNTIGAAFVSTEHTSGHRTVKMEIWDTAGQERYRSLTPMYYRNGRVALVCFDMSNAWASFEKARYWLDQLSVSGPSDISVKLVGTKSDLSNESTNSTNLETSNLDTNNLEINQSQKDSDTNQSQKDLETNQSQDSATNQRQKELENNQRQKDLELNDRNKDTLDKLKTDKINGDLNSNNLDISGDLNSNNSDISGDSNLGDSNLDLNLDMETGRGMVEIQRYCLEHDIPLYSTSAKTNTGIQKIFDDIVNEVEEDFFNEPAPQILLQERPQSKCC